LFCRSNSERRKEKKGRKVASSDNGERKPPNALHHIARKPRAPPSLLPGSGKKRKGKRNSAMPLLRVHEKGRGRLPGHPPACGPGKGSSDTSSLAKGGERKEKKASTPSGRCKAKRKKSRVTLCSHSIEVRARKSETVSWRKLMLTNGKRGGEEGKA